MEFIVWHSRKHSKILQEWPPIPWEKVPSNHHWTMHGIFTNLIVKSSSELSWNQLLQCSALHLATHPWHPQNSWPWETFVQLPSWCSMTGLRTLEPAHEVLCKWLICPAGMLETPMSLVEWYDINWLACPLYIWSKTVCVCVCVLCFELSNAKYCTNSIFGGEDVVPLPTSFIQIRCYICFHSFWVLMLSLLSPTQQH